MVSQRNGLPTAFFAPLGAGTRFHGKRRRRRCGLALARGQVKALAVTSGMMTTILPPITVAMCIIIPWKAFRGPHSQALCRSPLQPDFHAQRFSELVGNGDMGAYLFGPLTDRMWRLSLGLGYRWNQHLVLKTEYTLERGRETSGVKRDHEDMFATEAVFGF